MQFFCIHYYVLVATSVNSAMKICLACSLCDMKNPMPQKLFYNRLFWQLFLNKGFQFEKKPDSNVSFCIEWWFFFQYARYFYVLTIGFILHLFSRQFLALNHDFNFLHQKFSRSILIPFECLEKLSNSLVSATIGKEQALKALLYS